MIALRKTRTHTKSSSSLVIAAIFLSVIAGCSDPQQQVLQHQVTSEPVNWTIHATGELEATTATPVTGPQGRGHAKTISWLAPNNSRVSKGDLLIKFDPYTYIEDKAKNNYNLQRIDAEKVITEGQVLSSNDQVEKGLKEVSYQREKSEKIDWENSAQVVAKIDLIDKMENIDFLNTKEDFYEWKDEKNQVQNEASEAILKLEEQSYQDKLKRAEEALQAMSITAPHDGIFVYQKNWSGEEPYPGMKVWPGMKVGQLPDLTKLQAKIWVREQDAVGLKKDLKISMILDAYPEQTFSGTIIKVDQFAKPKERKNPVKYVEVAATIDGLDPSKVLPGFTLSAEIFVHQLQSGISIPTQAIFSEGERQYVFKKTSDGYEKASVAIGFRNLTSAEITSGLEAGDIIALHRPSSQ